MRCVRRVGTSCRPVKEQVSHQCQSEVRGSPALFAHGPSELLYGQEFWVPDKQVCWPHFLWDVTFGFPWTRQHLAQWFSIHG